MLPRTDRKHTTILAMNQATEQQQLARLQLGTAEGYSCLFNLQTCHGLDEIKWPDKQHEDVLPYAEMLAGKDAAVIAKHGSLVHTRQAVM